VPGLSRLEWRQAPLDPDYSQTWAYQGLFPRDTLRRIGAPESSFHIDGLEFLRPVVPSSRAALIYASHLTTVSSTYAKEITQPELGCGLEGPAAHPVRRGAVDGNRQRPSTKAGTRASVRKLAQPFGAGRLGRQSAPNADYVRGQFGPSPVSGGGPDLRSGSPGLVHQKGIDLVLSAADEIIDAGGQIVVTGFRRNRRSSRRWSMRNRRRPDAIGVDDRLQTTARRDAFSAGSDFHVDALAPSKPCGLSQMYAQRFGSLPIGHQTGGLAETITRRRDRLSCSRSPRFGVLPLGGIRRAFSTFMATDRLDLHAAAARWARSFSWDLSAACYSAPVSQDGIDLRARSTSSIPPARARFTAESGSNSPAQGGAFEHRPWYGA